jgi:hypothetical protein
MGNSSSGSIAVHLGPNASVDDVAANIERISDMSEATPFGQGGEVTVKIFQTMPS